MDAPKLEKLSPSRASDFKRCPKLFQYRAIDRLEEPKAPVAALGNLVHMALEDLHSMKPEDRTHTNARAILSDWYKDRGETEWADLQDVHYKKACKLVDQYFEMEDPTQVNSTALEYKAAWELDGIIFRGIIDRIDVVGEHELLVDYKTGRTPGENFEQSAFFGLRFYALARWRETGKMPSLIRLMYLDSKETLSLQPTEQMLKAYERQIRAIADAIKKAMAKDDFRARQGKMCKFCSFTNICPAWEGITPPWEIKKGD